MTGAARAKPTNRAPWLQRDVVGILDRLTDGVVVLDRDSRARYVNERAGVILGRPRTELLGNRIWSEFPDGVGHPCHQTCEAAARSGLPQRTVAQCAANERWLESRVFPQADELVLLLRDVTDEQHAERDLREYADSVTEAERIVRFGVWKWDIASGRVRWSDELHRIYGLAPGEFGGTVDAFMEQLHEGDRERVWANIARSMETHEPFVFEERIVRADRAVRVLLSQGRVLTGPEGAAQALVGVCHDVTDRAGVERALGASERRMRAIIDNTPSLISVKDLDGRYLMSNAESERVLGISADDLVGMRCFDVFPAEVAEVQRANDLRATSEGEPVYGKAV